MIDPRDGTDVPQTPPAPGPVPVSAAPICPNSDCRAPIPNGETICPRCGRVAMLGYLPPNAMDFPDRSARLIAAGIILVLCGMSMGCLTAMIPVATMLPQPGQPPVSIHHLAPALLMYGTLTLILLSLGAGSIIKRRWSRPLTMIFSTHWLIAGVLMLLMVPLLWSAIRDQATANAPPSVATQLVIGMVIGLGLIAVFMVAMPLTVLLLVRHNDVRRTLEHHDPYPRWTDRCPLPVLGLALTLFVIGLLTLTAIPQAVVPAFGTYFSGLVARLILLALTAGYLASGYLVYALRMSGWWLGLLLTVIGSLAIVPSALWMPLGPYYAHAGMTQDQIDMLLEHEQAIRLSMAIVPVVFGAAFALYMLRTRKHMTPVYPLMSDAMQPSP